MGRRGPAPTPTKKLELAGSWLAKTRKGEPVPKLSAPTCPACLSKVARDEWKRVVGEMMAVRTLAKTDRAALAAYCQSWADYIHAIEVVRKEGMTFTTPKGYVAKNPMVTIMNESRSALLRFSQELGLTPSARTRVMIDSGSPEDERDKRMFKSPWSG